jgi:putative hemolysin
MSGVLANIGLVAVFILVGALFAGAEIALVSLREGQVKGMAERSRRGRRVAALAADPNRYLAAVQVGVTLAGFLSAAFGAATLANDLAPSLEDAGLSEGTADTVALVVITLVISYFSILLSELVPKRLALQRAEAVAQVVAGPLDRVASLTRPVIWLLSKSTDVVVRLLGGDPGAPRDSITEDELRGLVAAHESLSKDERKLIDEVFAAGERQLREVMVPRTEVEFLDGGMTVARAAKVTSTAPHSRYPVARDSQDDVLGFVHVRDLLVPASKGRTLKVSDVTRDVKLLPDTKKVLPALSEMRREGHHLAIVVDEFGGTAGIVTLEDLIEEVIGDIRDEYDVQGDDPLLFRGGEIEADGLLNLDEVEEQTGVRLPDGPYETLAGYVMAALGHVPRQGEAVEVDGHRLEVSQLDGRRVSRVRVTPLPLEGQDPLEEAS